MKKFLVLSAFALIPATSFARMSPAVFCVDGSNERAVVREMAESLASKSLTFRVNTKDGDGKRSFAVRSADITSVSGITLIKTNDLQPVVSACVTVMANGKDE